MLALCITSENSNIVLQIHFANCYPNSSFMVPINLKYLLLYQGLQAHIILSFILKITLT